MVRQWQIPEGQRHAAATLRNLATPEHISTLVTSGVVEVLVGVVTNAKTLQPVLHEVPSYFRSVLVISLHLVLIDSLFTIIE